MAEKKPLCDFGKQIEIALIQKDKYGNYYALKTFLYLSRELHKRFGYVNPLWYEI